MIPKPRFPKAKQDLDLQDSQAEKILIFRCRTILSSRAARGNLNGNVNGKANGEVNGNVSGFFFS